MQLKSSCLVTTKHGDRSVLKQEEPRRKEQNQVPIRGRRRSLLMKPAVDLSKLIENCQKRSWLSLVFGEKCPSPKKTSVAEKSPSPRKNRRTSFGRRAVQISTQQEKHSSLNLSQQTTKGCRKTFGDYKKNLSARFYNKADRMS